MAENMKSVKLRIKSVKNTMQITKAMELVASSKLRKAKERAEICRPYFLTLHQTLRNIAEENTDYSSIYAKNAQNDKYCYVLIAGDRGLAGGYNANLLKCFESDSADKEFVVLPIGKKALDYCKRKKISCLTERFAEIADISKAECFEIAKLLCEEFKAGAIGHLDMCYTTFTSMLAQQPSVISALPLTDLRGETAEDAVRAAGEGIGKRSAKDRKLRNIILYEPSAEEVFDEIVPEYVSGLVYGAVCESLASELAARRAAMESATSNARDMIDRLNLYYNRARQASITQEITEIVAGAENI